MEQNKKLVSVIAITALGLILVGLAGMYLLSDQSNQGEAAPKDTAPTTNETPTSKATETQIPQNAQGGFIEGVQDSYKVNDTIKFTLVFKEGEGCSTIEMSHIATENSEFLRGIGIDDWCHSPFLSEDLRISIPYPGEASPFKTDKVGPYKIEVTKDGEVVLEKEFTVTGAD